MLHVGNSILVFLLKKQKTNKSYSVTQTHDTAILTMLFWAISASAYHVEPKLIQII